MFSSQIYVSQVLYRGAETFIHLEAMMCPLNYFFLKKVGTWSMPITFYKTCQQAQSYTKWPFDHLINGHLTLDFHQAMKSVRRKGIRMCNALAPCG